MTTLTIRIPAEVTEKVSGFIESLGGEIVSAEQTKEELRQEIKEAVAEMKLIRTGKKQARNAEEFLNAL
ncbi:MAG: hypothetical protein ACRYFL_06550 [Janthinobacterium lividum]